MTKRVLVIDDHFETLRLTSLVLQRHGFQVDTAQSGLEGMKQARTQVPDLVLLDIMMPEIDGLEVCRHFRNDDMLKKVPIMMFTARSQPRDMTEAYEAGANDYIVKPTRPQDLVDRVQNALDKYTITLSNVDESKTARVSMLIGIVDATDNSGGFIIASKLAELLAAKHHQVSVIDIHNPRQISIPGVVWHDASATNLNRLLEQIKQDAKVGDVIVNIGKPSAIPSSLIDEFTHMLVAITPDISSIMATQAFLKVMDEEAKPIRSYYMMLDYNPTPSVTREAASEFLQHPVVDVFDIDRKDADLALESGKPITLSSAIQAQFESLLESLMA